MFKLRMTHIPIQLTLVVCILTVQLDAHDVFIAQTGNYLRCRKLCMYQEACSRIHFKNGRCLLITDTVTSHGVKVNKPGVNGNVCEKSDVCVPTGIVPPGYRHENLLGVDLIGLKGFKIYTTGINFDGAREHCADQGGQLFVVENFNEWQTIVNLANSGDIMAGVHGLWINGNDIISNGNYVTTVGEPMPLELWGPNEPSHTNAGGSQEDCVELLQAHAFRMNDAHCWAVNRGFVCQWVLF